GGDTGGKPPPLPEEVARLRRQQLRELARIAVQNERVRMPLGVRARRRDADRGSRLADRFMERGQVMLAGEVEDEIAGVAVGQDRAPRDLDEAIGVSAAASRRVLVAGPDRERSGLGGIGGGVGQSSGAGRGARSSDCPSWVVGWKSSRMVRTTASGE